MGCSSSAAVKEKTIKDDSSEITRNTTSQENQVSKPPKNESLNNLLSSDEIGHSQDYDILLDATNLSIESTPTVTIHRKHRERRIREQQDGKGDGISTMSLTSQIVSENGGELPKSSLYERRGTQGEMTVAQTESDLILEKALKELSESLFKTNEENSPDLHVPVCGIDNGK